MKPQANKGESNLGFANLPEVAINSQLAKPLIALESLLQTQARVLVCAESAGRREALLELFKKLPQQPQEVESWLEFCQADMDFAICVAPLGARFKLPCPAAVSD
jgi:transcription-repair coupling factor (superfamily II helicase)